MIDHFFQFNNETSAFDALTDYFSVDENGKKMWNGSCVLPNQKVVMADAVWDGETLINPEQKIPGFFITISLDSLDVNLQNLANGACRIITDRDKAQTGDFILYKAADLTNETIQSIKRIEPVFAGSDYPFGVIA